MDHSYVIATGITFYFPHVCYFFSPFFVHTLFLCFSFFSTGGFGLRAMASYASRIRELLAIRKDKNSYSHFLTDEEAENAKELADRLTHAADISFFREFGGAKPKPNPDDKKKKEEEEENEDDFKKDDKNTKKRDFMAPFRRHWDDVQAMKPGEYRVWDCGWFTVAGGHAVVLVLQRGSGDDSNTGSVTLCNTGQGVENHPSSVANFYPKNKYRTALHIGPIPWWKICDDSMIYTFLRSFIPLNYRLNDGSNGPPSMYQTSLPYLVGGPVEPVIQANEEKGLHGDWETIQRSGTCYFGLR
jgi:hypothetical protein